MNPITHFLVSWTLADSVNLADRDRRLITWCGVLPDLDGLGVVVDAANRLSGHSSSSYYTLYHHSLLHGLAAILVIPGMLCVSGVRRWKVFWWGVVVGHLHLACDLAGSRGTEPDDVWPVKYLAPFSGKCTLTWNGQWPINSWPNITLTIVLLFVVFVAAARRGYSPVGLFSVHADKAFVEAVRGWKWFM
jgi:inner membrane protein